MSGYMVTTEGNGHRNFYMVNAEDPDRAAETVNKLMGVSDAKALSPIPAETLDHFKVAPGDAWLCTTTDLKGEVTHSEIAKRG